MVIADFQVENKVNKPRFFQENFLVANTKFEVILGVLFLKLSNAIVLYGEKIPTWRTNTINEVLFITKRIWTIYKIDFVIVVLNADSKIFVIHIAI